MISLGFVIKTLVDFGSVKWLTVGETQLRYDCFHGDIEFVVDEMDLSVKWGWVPIFDFALSMRMIADELVESGYEVFQYTDSDFEITFTLQNGQVKVEANYVEGSASLDIDEFRIATDQLLARVRNKIETDFPDLLANVHYRNALRQYI